MYELKSNNKFFDNPLRVIGIAPPALRDLEPNEALRLARAVAKVLLKNFVPNPWNFKELQAIHDAEQSQRRENKRAIGKNVSFKDEPKLPFDSKSQEAVLRYRNKIQDALESLNSASLEELEKLVSEYAKLNPQAEVDIARKDVKRAESRAKALEESSLRFITESHSGKIITNVTDLPRAQIQVIDLISLYNSLGRGNIEERSLNLFKRELYTDGKGGIQGGHYISHAKMTTKEKYPVATLELSGESLSLRQLSHLLHKYSLDTPSRTLLTVAGQELSPAAYTSFSAHIPREGLERIAHLLSARIEKSTASKQYILLTQHFYGESNAKCFTIEGLVTGIKELESEKSPVKPKKVTRTKKRNKDGDL